MKETTENMDDLFAAAKNAKVDYSVDQVAKVVAGATAVGAIGGAAASMFNLSKLSIMVGSVITVATTIVVFNLAGNPEPNPTAVNNKVIVTEKVVEPKQKLEKTHAHELVVPVYNDPEIPLMSILEPEALETEQEIIAVEEEITEEPEFLIASEGMQAVEDTEDKRIGYFHSIRLEIAADIHIRNSTDGGNKFDMQATDEIKDMIDVFVDNKTLVIRAKDKERRKLEKLICRNRVAIELTMDDVKSILINGSGDVHGLGNLNSDKMSVTINGSGDVIFDDVSPNEVHVRLNGSGDVGIHGSGKVKSGKIEINGSGDVCTGNNEIDDLSIAIRGSGDVNTISNGAMAVSILGSGDVNYSGNPQLSVSSHGSGEVHHSDKSNCGRE